MSISSSLSEYSDCIVEIFTTIRALILPKFSIKISVAFYFPLFRSSELAGGF